jgi:dienelactone hydrolase
MKLLNSIGIGARAKALKSVRASASILMTAVWAAVSISSTASAAVVKKTLVYHLAGKDYEGYLAYDDATKTPAPGVLVAHNWMGVTDTTKERVDELAKLGYVAFAVDIYGKGIRPSNTDEAGKLAGGFKKDRVALRGRMQEGLKVLKALPQVDKARVAVIGYCFGGTAALELARAGADVKDVVTFHGGLDSPKPEDGKRIKAKLLILHGADDPFESKEDLAAFEQEMRDSKLDWQLVKYGNAVHSFTEKAAGNDNSKGAAYNELADKRSWLAMKDFFKENL